MLCCTCVVWAGGIAPRLQVLNVCFVVHVWYGQVALLLGLQVLNVCFVVLVWYGQVALLLGCRCLMYALLNTCGMGRWHCSSAAGDECMLCCTRVVWAGGIAPRLQVLNECFVEHVWYGQVALLRGCRYSRSSG
jgi:hypothetical protein